MAHTLLASAVLVQSKAASKRQKQGSVQTGRQFESADMVDNSPVGPVSSPQQPDATARSPAATASGPGAAANSPPDLQPLGTIADKSNLRAAAGSPRAAGHNLLLGQASSPLGAGEVRSRTARRTADPVSPRADADGPKAAAPGPAAAAAELPLALAIRQDETPTNPGALVIHHGVVPTSPRLKSAGPASAAQAAAGAVVPGPRSAEEDALAVAPVAPSSMEWASADVHDMMTRLVFKTDTHNVCSMVPALCNNTVPCHTCVCHSHVLRKMERAPDHLVPIDVVAGLLTSVPVFHTVFQLHGIFCLPLIFCWL